MLFKSALASFTDSCINALNKSLTHVYSIYERHFKFFENYHLLK